nr:MAG TPA: hypothetical protein [Caudoviricetes sp.]
MIITSPPFKPASRWLLFYLRHVLIYLYSVYEKTKTTWQIQIL